MPSKAPTASAGRTVWLLNAKALGERLLGPGVRLLETVRVLREAGHEVRVVVEDPRSNPFPAGVVLRGWEDFRLEEIRPGDAVVANAYVAFPRLWRLLRSGIPFHLDLYCLTATEMLPAWEAAGNGARGLHKRRLRYVMAAARAERTWVSCSEQALLLSGMLLSEARWDRAVLANRFGPSCHAIPMGVSSAPFSCGAENPYPPSLHGRPVFLWGGNLWSWMDLETLAEAFGILARRGDPAVLFLLSGSNRSGRTEEDGPAKRLADRCRELGILGTSVVFNDVQVDPAGLAPWLEHACAGIMTNPATLEAAASWRTRYLDLLWAGRPLVVAGRDPLGDRMAAAGAAIQVPARDAAALADAVSALSLDPGRAADLGAASRSLGQKMTWKDSLRPFLSDLSDPSAFRGRGVRPGWRDLARYFLS